MSQPAADRSANPLVRWWQAWDRFWFHPADPTSLGLIRIFCGLVTLYVHVAYSYDLQEFFGKNAWFNWQASEEMRQEVPYLALPLGSWRDPEPSFPLPEGGRNARSA